MPIYGAFFYKQFAPWTGQWDMGTMVRCEAGLHIEGSQARSAPNDRWDTLYRGSQLGSTDRPFTLEMVGLAFIIVGCGLTLSLAAFAAEFRAHFKILQ